MTTNLLKGVNLYLIGMMGSGKTTVGQILAQRLGYRFFDTDAVVEQAIGQSISQFFAAEGEAAFRKLETQVLAELAPYTRMTIATGGGIVLQRENWSYLRHGIILWLDVPLEQIEYRLAHDTSRPLLQGSELRIKLQTLMEQRRSLYAQADVHLVCRPEETPGQVADRAIEQIQAVLRSEASAPENLPSDE